MEIGTAEPLSESAPEKKRRAALTGGTGRSGGGGNGRGPGGGGDRPDGPNDADLESSSLTRDKSRILTAFLLLVVMMTFGGLIAAYVVIATNGVAEWRPFALPIPVWVSTVLIIVSSLVYHIGARAAAADDLARAHRWFIATTAIGAAFISSQMLVWLELRSRGLYMGGNPYAGFFYLLTAVHAVHVVGGIAALGTLVLRTRVSSSDGVFRAKTRSLSQVVGWYWHFMGGLWLVLFFLLGYWN